MTTNPPIAADPWDLSHFQRRVMSALVKTGCNKAIARETGQKLKTIECQLRMAKLKMGQPNRVLAALMWERFERGAAP